MKTSLKKTNIFKNNKFSFLSFGIVFVIITLFMVINKVIPFGNQSLLCSDLYIQYAPLFNELCDKVANGGSMFYSFDVGLGVPFFGNFVNYLCSPLTLIVLILGKSNIEFSVTLIVLLKSAISAFTFSYFIRKVFNTNSVNIVSFGLLYGLSDFFIAFYWNVMWYDAVYILPLVMLGIYKLINEKKCGLYVFALAYTLITNYYMGYMVCIASVIFYLYFYFTQTNKDKLPTKYSFIKCSGRFAVASIISGAMSAFILIPTYFILQNSSATNGTMPLDLSAFFSFTDFISNHFAFTTATFRSASESALPNIYCGVFTIILFVIYFTEKKISFKEKLHTALVWFLFFISFNLKLLNYIWHGFHFPNDLPFRFSYIYIAFLLFVAYKAFTYIESATKKKILIVTGCWIAFAIETATIIITGTQTSVTVPFTIFMLICYCLLLLLFLKGKKKTASVLICVLVIVELFIPNVNSFMCYPSNGYNKYTEDIVKANTIVNNDNSSSFKRFEFMNHITFMDASIYNTNNISTFSSMNYETVSHIQKHLGVQGNGINSNKYFSQTPIYNMMMGINYMLENPIDKLPANGNYYTKIGTANEYNVLKSNYITSIGFSSISSLSDEEWTYASINPFINQNSFLKCATGIDNALLPAYGFTEIDNNGIEIIQEGKKEKGTFKYLLQSDSTNENNNCTMTLLAENDANYYIFVKSRQLDITIKTPNTKDISIKPMYDDSRIVDVGFLQKGDTVTIQFCQDKDKTLNEGTFDMFVAYADDQKINEAYKKISENGIINVTEFTDDKMVGTVSSKTDYVYTSIPYDTSWDVVVDGQKLNSENILQIGEGLTCLHIGSGNHTIEFTYRLKGFGVGIGITTTSIVIWIALWYLHKKKFVQQ